MRPKAVRTRITRFAAAAVVIALWAGVGLAEDPADQPMIDTEAPQFELESVNGHAPVSLGELRGGYVVVHFAASW